MTALADRRRWNREHSPCGIKGCGRTAYRGALCRKHWDMVPWNNKAALMNEVMTSSHNIGKKHHKRFLGLVRAIEAAPE